MNGRSVRDCNVVVIGGAGFLGSHLVNCLIDKRNCHVTVVDNLCVGQREFVHEDAQFVHHDITGSEEFLRTLFVSEKIQYVFNYAAWPYIPDSFERPLQVFSVNATGAIKVINAAQEAGCKGILQVSSAELYGSAEGNCSIDEDFPVNPRSTYGAAKAAVDYYCQSAWRERQTPVIALRQFNCVGERETHPYVIPEIMSQLLEYGPTISLGNNSSRDFIYAGDAVHLAVELLETGDFGEVYNLGSEDSIQIYDLASLIGELMGFGSIKILEDPDKIRPWEIWSLKSDNSKIRSKVTSRPYVSLTNALEKTISYYRSNGNQWGFNGSLSKIGAAVR